MKSLLQSPALSRPPLWGSLRRFGLWVALVVGLSSEAHALTLFISNQRTTVFWANLTVATRDSYGNTVSTAHPYVFPLSSTTRLDFPPYSTVTFNGVTVATAAYINKSIGNSFMPAGHWGTFSVTSSGVFFQEGLQKLMDVTTGQDLSFYGGPSSRTFGTLPTSGSEIVFLCFTCGLFFGLLIVSPLGK
jgi:hypothetical protein